MSAHASLEQLSSYLDTELVVRERQRVESHLEGCTQCRHRLEGLRSVVTRLERLEQQAPPRDLAILVERQVAAEAVGESLRVRLEDTVRTFLVQPSLVPVFGLVVALAAILYLFSMGVARNEQRGTRLVPVLEPAPSRVALVEGRTFGLAGGVWVENGLEPPAPSRLFEYRESRELPQVLRPFADLGDRVMLAHEGRAVELRRVPKEGG